MFFFILFMVLLLFLILTSVAFITLFERHLLGLSQNRLGPQKVSFYGFLQAIFDGLKLFKKELSFPKLSYSYFFFLMPFFSFFLMLMNWLIFPFCYFFYNFNYVFLFFLCLVGVSVYFMLLSGIFSKSKYSFLGGIRSSCQSVSFEVIFFLLMFCFLIMFQSFFFLCFFNLIFFLIYLILFILVLVELNRAPFDFSESESELVSGFNLEFGGVFFVLLFLSEYGFLIFFSLLFSYVFFFGYIFCSYFLFFLVLLVRSSYPRYRYDLLMMFFWLILLPFISLIFMFFFLWMYLI